MNLGHHCIADLAGRDFRRGIFAAARLARILRGRLDKISDRAGMKILMDKKGLFICFFIFSFSRTPAAAL